MKGRFAKIAGVSICMILTMAFTFQVFAAKGRISFGTEDNENPVFGHAEELSYDDEETDDGIHTITLGKIPADCLVDTDNYNVFIKDLLDEIPEAFENAQIDREEVEGFMSNADNEILMFPAGYTADNAPYYILIFITDGFTNVDSRLSKLSSSGTAYLLDLLRGYYVEEEQPVFSAMDLPSERFITCDRILLYEEEPDGYARDYYTVWNGDLVQAMVGYYEENMKEDACSALEEFLSSWTDYQE